MKRSKLFDPNGCLGAAALAAYAKGGLSAPERKRVQEHLASCELCADAAEGMQYADADTFPANVAVLNAGIDRRVAQEQKRNLYPVWLAAASVLVLLGIGALWLRNTRPEPLPGLAVAKTAQKPDSEMWKLKEEALTKNTLEESKPPVPEAVAMQQPRAKAFATDVTSEAAADAMEAPAVEEETVNKERKLDKTELTSMASRDLASREPNKQPQLQSDAAAVSAKSIGAMPAKPLTAINMDELLAFAESHVNTASADKADRDDANEEGMKREMKARYSPAFAERKKSNAPDTALKHALMLYNKKEYLPAAAAFKALPAGEQNATTRICMVIACIKGDDLNAAHKAVNQLADYDENAALFLQVLICIKDHKNDQAREILSSLAEGNSVFSAKASQLLDQLH